MGIEPTFSAWEADVLPLNYTRAKANFMVSALTLKGPCRFAGVSACRGTTAQHTFTYAGAVLLLKAGGDRYFELVPKGGISQNPCL